jgi:hypothetical protein
MRFLGTQNRCSQHSPTKDNAHQLAKEMCVHIWVMIHTSSVTWFQAFQMQTLVHTHTHTLPFPT